MFYLVLHSVCVYVCMYYLVHMWFRICGQVYLQSATDIRYLLNISDFSRITSFHYEIFPSDIIRYNQYLRQLWPWSLNKYLKTLYSQETGLI